MKKTLITSACVLAVSGAAFAQGVVSWSTINPNDMSAQTNSTVLSPFSPPGATLAANIQASIGGTSTTADSFYYELLYNTAATQQTAPASMAALATWTSAGLEAVNNTGTAGRLQNLGATTAAAVPWAQGTYDSIVLVGWSANLGSTWATAYANLQNYANLAPTLGVAFFGVSTTGYITPNTSPASGATLWGSAANPNGTPIF